MKIVVNTRFLLADKLEGIGWFTYETLSRMVKDHPEHDFVFLFDREFDQKFIFGQNVRGVKLFPPARHPFLWYWWFEKSVKKILKREKPDVFLSTDGYLSTKSKVPQLVVMHDLAFEHYPDDVGGLVRKFYKKYSPIYARVAKRIVTVSEFTKQDIVQKYHIDKHKIDVIYNGVNASFSPVSTTEQVNIKSKYTGGQDYFVYVGSIHPRKNILNLLKAYEQFRQQHDAKIKLVLAGRKGWSNEDMEAYYEQMTFKKDVVFTGRVTTEELNHLLGAAQALTYISYFEGFGIPVIEAQQCGCPVITSNKSSLPEVAGDAALLVDPFSIEGIITAMMQVIDDKILRDRLVQNGFQNAKRFSWNLTAKQLYESLEKTVNSNSNENI